MYKRQTERPRRAWLVWAFDASKQVLRALAPRPLACLAVMGCAYVQLESSFAQRSDDMPDVQ